MFENKECRNEEFKNRECRNKYGHYDNEENNEFFRMEEEEHGFEGEFGRGREEGQEPEFAEEGFRAEGQEFQGQCRCPQGQTRRYTSNTNINGKTCNINNKYYYDNYYNRYNKYCVNDINYVKRYIRDINVWYYSTRTIDCGTEYLGATNINGGCQGGCNCSPCNNRC